MLPPTEPIDLNELDASWAASTQGEWKHHIQEFIKGRFDRVLSAPSEVVIRDEDINTERHHWKRDPKQDANWNAIAALHNAFPRLRDELLAARKRIVELEKIESDLTTKGAMQFEAFDDFLQFIEQTMNTVVAAQNGVIKGPELAPGVAALRAKIYSAGPGWLAARDARIKAEGAAEALESFAVKLEVPSLRLIAVEMRAEAERLRSTK